MAKTITFNEEMIECRHGDRIYMVPEKVFYEVLFRMEHGEKKYVRYETGAKMFDVSRGIFIRLARDAQAIHKYEGTTLVDPIQVSKFVDGLDSGR